MLFMSKPDTKSVHILADLLETIEVTADELLDQRLAARGPLAADADADVALQSHLSAARTFVRTVRDLEFSLLAKLEMARARARVVGRNDWRLRPIMALFTSGTQALVDHLASPEQRAALQFDGGRDVFAFLRSRDLLPPAAEHFDGSQELLVTHSFRIFGTVKLHEVLDQCEVALNALDAHYDLYEMASDEDSYAEETAIEIRTSGPEGVTAPPAVSDIETGQPQDQVSDPSKAGDSETARLESLSDSSDVQPPRDLPEAEPDEAQLAAARVASEDSLKRLTERLADLKAADDAAPTAKPANPDAA